jgi:hypothetical protein
MALDSRFVLAFTFEKYFVDKDSGFPLANGYINFYEDTQRSVPKEVFTLSGTPANYTYVSLGSTVNLNSVGVPEDSNGNNVAIYFFPYDGNQETSTGQIQQYFYQVFSEGDVEQFSRAAQPDIFADGESATVNDNYIPNGQFLLHNDIPATNSNDNTVGQISQPITVIAPGGWTFEMPSGATDVNIVTFERLDSLNFSVPLDQPRYQFKLEVEELGISPGYKYLAVKFNGVNKFASTTQQYTFVFWGQSIGTNVNNINFLLYKNYGSVDGSTPDTITKAAVNFSTVGETFAIPFTFGTNVGKTLGSNNDDYVQLILSFPTEELFQLYVTDVGLFEGAITTPTFAPTTNRQFTYRAIYQDMNLTGANFTGTSAPLPSPYVMLPGSFASDGSTLYLPKIDTLAGTAYDTNVIGNIETQSSYNVADWDTATGLHISTNLINPALAYDKQFETAGYSALGIPFSRLQAKYWISSLNMPRYGTGASYFQSTIPAADNNLLLCDNAAGTVSVSTAGTTTFTVTEVHTPATTTYFTKSYIFPTELNSYNLAEFALENLNVGTVTASIAVGTSGFGVGVYQNGNGFLPQINVCIPTAAAPLADPGNPGKYFTFYSINNSAANVLWYVWYKVDAGTETDPAPGGTGILVRLLGADTAAIVSQKTQQALNTWQESNIATVAAASITGGQYWTASSAVSGGGSTNYRIWYEVNGAGTEPSGSEVKIKVTLTGSETAAQVATATQIAINMKYFSVPDYRGLFFRSWANGSTVDRDRLSRFSLVPGVVQDVIGTLQESENESHIHALSDSSPLWVNDGTGAATGGPGSDLNDVSVTIEPSGGYEARPVNISVLPVIRY